MRTHRAIPIQSIISCFRVTIRGHEFQLRFAFHRRGIREPQRIPIHCRETTALNYERILRHHVFPSIGGKVFDAVTREDIKGIIAAPSLTGRQDARGVDA